MEETRTYWLEQLRRVAEPPLTAMAEGELVRRMPLRHHAKCETTRLDTVRLELAGRILCGLAPWLGRKNPAGEEERMRADLAEKARAAIIAGSDPDHPDYWNFEGGHQAVVDAAFLACAFIRGGETLWDPLPTDAKERVLTGFRTLRRRAPGYNNWLLFGAVPEVFLARIGEEWDPMRVDYAIRQMDQWYVGDGLYADGPAYHEDYYNSIVIHPLLMDLVEEAAIHDERWRGFVEPVRYRLRRYAAIQERQIHTDGSWPIVGRSLPYRTGVFHALSYAAWRGLLPGGLGPGRVRAALTAALRRGLAPASNFDENGWLRIGVNGDQPGLGEHYITTASCYLASFVFTALALSPEAPFWSDADEPWTARQVWELGRDFPADHAW